MKEQNEELKDYQVAFRSTMQIYEVQYVSTGLTEHVHKNKESVLRLFIQQELRTRHRIEFADVHRFGKGVLSGRRLKGRPRSIVARFHYRQDFEAVILNAFRLKEPLSQLNNSFTDIIEQARRSLYHIMKEKQDQGHQVNLLKDF